MKEILSAILQTLHEMFTVWFPLIKNIDLGLIGMISKGLSILAAIVGFIEFLRRRDR